MLPISTNYYIVAAEIINRQFTLCEGIKNIYMFYKKKNFFLEKLR